MAEQKDSPSKRGRPGITYEQVVAGIQTLLAEKKRVTQRNLIALLGGGAGTIQKHLNTYRNSHEQQIVVNATLPESLQRVILSEMEKSNAEAVAEAQKRLEDAQDDLKSLAEENTRQLADIDMFELNTEALQGEVQRQLGTINQMHVELARLTESEADARAAAEVARQEKAIADTRLEVLPKLEQELGLARSAVEALREAAAAASQRAALAEGSLAEATQRLAETQTALAKGEATLDSLRAAAAAGEQRAAVAEATLAESSQRLDEAKERARLSADLVRQQEQTIERQAREIVQGNARVEAITARLEGAAREVDTANKSAREAREAAKVAGEIAAELRGQLAALSAVKTTPGKAKKSEPKAEGSTGP